MEDRQFLKSILPLSDELNDILGMIFEVDPTRRITLPELRHRIINCQHFTKPQLPTSTYVDPVTYDEALSPASSVSDECSMVSDNSDDSTTPSEVDPVCEDDFASFQVMEETDYVDSTFQDQVPEALPEPKVAPEAWILESVSVESMKYVAPRSSSPFDCGNSRSSAETNQGSFVFNAPVNVVGSHASIHRPVKVIQETLPGPAVYSGFAPTSYARGPTTHYSTTYNTRFQAAKRSHPRGKPTFRGNPWQNANSWLNHSLPQRVC